MNDNAIRQVFSAYEMLKDSVKVTRRSILRDVSNLHTSTTFLGARKDEIVRELARTEVELEDIMILSIFASFERELRVSIQNAIFNSTTIGNTTMAKFMNLTKESIERWSVSDMLESLSEIVDGDLRGRVIQIYKYRNWVAHGRNPLKPPDILTDPKTVATVLSSFTGQASTVI